MTALLTGQRLAERLTTLPKDFDMQLVWDGTMFMRNALKEITKTLGETITIVALVVGFAGLAMLVGPQLFGAELNGKYILGVVIIQVGCFFWQAGSAYAKRRPTGVSPPSAAGVRQKKKSFIGQSLAYEFSLCRKMDCEAGWSVEV